MARLPLEPLVIAITLRYEPDLIRNGYNVSAFGLGTVGGWKTPVEIHPGMVFVDAADLLPDIGLNVVASEIQPFIDKARIQALQKATKAARQSLKDRRKP